MHLMNFMLTGGISESLMLILVCPRGCLYLCSIVTNFILQGGTSIFLKLHLLPHHLRVSDSLGQLITTIQKPSNVSIIDLAKDAYHATQEEHYEQMLLWLSVRKDLGILGKVNMETFDGFCIVVISCPKESDTLKVVW